MTGKIFDIKHFAVHDGDGIRTTVFFKGCPLRCLWCHNPESLSKECELALLSEKCIGCGACARACQSGGHSLEDTHALLREKCTACGACERVCPTGALTLYGKEVTTEEILPELLEDVEFYEASGGGVTLSGGECLLQADFCAKLLKALKDKGIHTAVDTSGCVSREAIDKVLPYTDIFLYDVKAIDEDVHIRCTGASNRKILENLAYLDSVRSKIEVRIPFVPGCNDGEMQKIAKHLSHLPSILGVKVLPYHSYARSKYVALGVKDTLPRQLPTQTELEEAKRSLFSFGLKVL